MAQRRILLLNTLMEVGGAQKAIMQLARGLADRGHQVTVATMYDKTGSIPTFEEEFGLPILDLAMNPPASHLGKATAMFRGAILLRQVLAEQRVEVIQSFTHYSNILGPIVGWSVGVPVRVTSQRITLDDRSAWLRRADRQISRLGLAHRMVAVSEAVRRYCIEREGLAAERVVTIRNGIDPEPWAHGLEAGAARARTRADVGLDPKQVAVVTAARLAPQKGHMWLLDAVSLLAPRWPQAVFLWVGDGELRDELECKTRKRGLQGRIRFLGTRHDVPTLLKASDLFVLPSLWEGMPNAVLEAMAAGLPVVATAVDGTPEIVQHGVTGWLTPPKNPEALALAIEKALADPARRVEMGEAGRRRIKEEFSLERYVSGFEALYDELLRQASSAGAPSD